MGLTKRALQGKNERKALNAVAKLFDQNELFDIFQNAQIENVRIAAIKKVTDRKLLKVVVKNLTDQSALAYIANLGYHGDHPGITDISSMILVSGKIIPKHAHMC